MLDVAFVGLWYFVWLNRLDIILYNGYVQILVYNTVYSIYLWDGRDIEGS